MLGCCETWLRRCSNTAAPPPEFSCVNLFSSTLFPRGLFQKRFKFKPQVGHHWVFKMYQHKETYRISNWVGLFVVVKGTIPIPCIGTLHLCLKVKWKHYSKEEQTYMNILSLSLCFYYITVYLIIVVFWCILYYRFYSIYSVYCLNTPYTYYLLFTMELDTSMLGWWGKGIKISSAAAGTPTCATGRASWHRETHWMKMSNSVNTQ